MDVNVLKEFTGFPDGNKKLYVLGPTNIPTAYVKEARLIEKGHVEEIKDTKGSAA